MKKINIEYVVLGLVFLSLVGAILTLIITHPPIKEEGIKLSEDVTESDLEVLGYLLMTDSSCSICNSTREGKTNISTCRPIDCNEVIEITPLCINLV